jgi:methylmalonyl-CoA epimerase
VQFKILLNAIRNQFCPSDEAMITGLKHVGIAVRNIDETLQVFEKTLGLKHEKTITLDERKLKIALLELGETKIELLEPMDKEGTIAKFLQNRGEGIHHIAFKVTDIENMLQQLKSKGVTLIDEVPRKGAEGGKVAFIHPKSTKNVLIELCEP